MSDFINVFIYRYPFQCINTPICKARREDIRKENAFRDEKIYTWRLLEIACREVLDKELNDLNPRKLETGKWVIDGCFISLSNSGNYVMCGISNQPVGVDIQKVRELGFECFKDRFTEKEVSTHYELLKKKPWNCFKIHTAKEALYKCYGSREMNWLEWDTIEYKNDYICEEYGEYYYSVASPLIKNGIKIDVVFNTKR